ncbi:MAG TPA: glycoside hydrolase family 5 protein [Polyangiaceae bacterium]|jgi:endoglucanase|nr:glycoside hydrolase family 5 protein [Polyangiaceae bacterium]
MVGNSLLRSTVFILVGCALLGCSSNGTAPGQSTGGSTSAGASGAPTSTGGSSGAGGSQVVISGSGGSLGGSTSGAGGSAGAVVTAGGGSSGAGSPNAGGDGGTMNALTPQQVVKAMAPGWNLGNTFDADPNETSWGNPETTQAMIQAVHAAGFNTMRIPVTWTDHIGAAPAYTIDPAWMAKVKQVATWANDAGMYAIVNTHHDADGQWILFNDPNSTTLSADHQAQITAKISAVWTQIATAFKSYGDHLILECFNEPGGVNQYSGGDGPSRAILNSYLVACMNAIRGTGSNNSTRYVMVQGIGAGAVEVSIKAVVIPNDDPNVLFSVHNYFPYAFASASTTTWGTSAGDYTDMSNMLEQVLSWLPPSQGIVMGEWGSVSADQLSSRVAYASAYAQDITKAGMCPVVWDDGGDFVLLDRSSNPPSWKYPTIVSALISGYKAGAAPGAMYAQSH